MQAHKINLVLLLMSFAFLCHAQNNLPGEEKQLLIYGNKEVEWHEVTYSDPRYKTVNIDDSLYKYDSLFTYKLLHYASTIPATIKWPFASLQKESLYLTIITSDDGLFRIYSWDNLMGGTMINFTAIVQFQSGDKTYAMLYPRHHTSGYEDGYNSSAYSDIYTLHANNKTYYIVAHHNTYSSHDYYDGVNTFTITNGRLNDTAVIFKTKTGLHNSISYEWSATGQYKAPTGYEYDNTIEFDEKAQTIKIPLVLDKGYVTKNFITYRFTGNYFENVSE